MDGTTQIRRPEAAFRLQQNLHEARARLGTRRPCTRRRAAPMVAPVRPRAGLRHPRRAGYFTAAEKSSGEVLSGTPRAFVPAIGEVCALTFQPAPNRITVKPMA